MGPLSPTPDLRSIAPGMAAETVSRIDERLDAIVAEHGVSIALAVESGSRAWGFPGLMEQVHQA